MNTVKVAIILIVANRPEEAWRLFGCCRRFQIGRSAVKSILWNMWIRSNVVHASVHTIYNHSIRHRRRFKNSNETEFHVCLDGRRQALSMKEPYFTFLNDGKGDINTWPFNKPFYLNLTFWGGMGWCTGIDETVLPTNYEIVMFGFIRNKNE